MADNLGHKEAFRQGGVVSQNPRSLSFGGRTVYSDSAEHEALVQRILRVDEHVWQRALESYLHMLKSYDSASRLSALRESWETCSPHSVPILLDARTSTCPICLEPSVEPVSSRVSAETYGLCANCGHGLLLSPPSPSEVYRGAEYYERRTESGVGYDAYPQEREYRETKAERLFNWIMECCGPITSLLEVGSGFGFSRAAAERRGWQTMGVDLNPAAASAAREIYNMQTCTGTLEQVLASGVVEQGNWDAVLYQFVLEHVADPVAELRHAAAAASANGFVVLLVPSMQAVERIVFGASYRSFRPDHLHLFSWKSLDICLSKAGLHRVASRSECSVHLLAGFLTREELGALYERGDGPDLVAIAEKEAT